MGPPINAKKKAAREINRVRWYIYSLSLISFILGMLEALSGSSSFPLIIYLGVGLIFLTLVFWYFERPALITGCCVVIQAIVLAGFVIYDPVYTRWLFFKVIALCISLYAFKKAFEFRNFSEKKSQG